MASLTSVTLSQLLLELPRGVASTLGPFLRARFGARWAEVPFFAAALMMRGTLATSSPLKHAVIDLPCPGWPPARVGTLLAVAIWLDHDRAHDHDRTGLQVLLLTARHTLARGALAELVAVPVAPVWRVLARAWIRAVEHDLVQTTPPPRRRGAVA